MSPQCAAYVFKVLYGHLCFIHRALYLLPFLLSECLPGVILTPPIRRSLAWDDNLCVAKSTNPVLCFSVLLKIFLIPSLIYSLIHSLFLVYEYLPACVYVCHKYARCLCMIIGQHVWICIIGVPGTLVVRRLWIPRD